MLFRNPNLATFSRRWLILLSLVLGCAEKVHIPQPKKRGDPSKAWQRLLNSAVSDEGVDYQVFRNRPRLLRRYLHWVGKHGQHTSWWGESKEDLRIAHLANAYNAAIIHAIIDQDPRHSTDDIQVGLYRWAGAGLHHGLRYRVDGEWVNLHKLSQVDAVSRYQEPLVWLMFHDGTQDSPPLRWWPNKGLQSKLKKEMRGFLASENGLNRTDSGWAAHPMFFEREKDFLYWHDKPNLCAWMADYTSGERRDWMRDHTEDCPLEQRVSRRALNHIAG